MCKKHEFKFEKRTAVILRGKAVEIEIFRCVNCDKIQIIDKEKCRVISLKGRLGEEAEL